MNISLKTQHIFVLKRFSNNFLHANNFSSSCKLAFRLCACCMLQQSNTENLILAALKIMYLHVREVSINS